MTTARSQTAHSHAPAGWSPSAGTDVLVRTAMRLDDEAVIGIVHTSIARNGVAAAWELLIEPAWRVVGDRATAEVPVIAERLFSRAVSQVLAAVRRARDHTPVRVLAACAAEEHQSLPLDAFAAALAELNTGSCLLGARVPARAVTSAVRRLRPTVVVIWSQARVTADARQIRSMWTDCPGVAVIAAGPGWDRTTLPESVPPCPDLPGALQRTLMLCAADDLSVSSGGRRPGRPDR